MFTGVLRIQAVTVTFCTIIAAAAVLRGSPVEERLGVTVTRHDSMKAIVEHLVHDSRYDAALRKLSAMPADAWSYVQKGKIHRCLQEWDTAIAALTTAKDMRYHYGEACYELGRVYEEGPFDLQEARDQYSWAWKYNHELYDACLRKAKITMRTRGYVHGIKELAQLVLENPSWQSSYELFSTLSFAFHQPELAASVARTLAARYPDEVRYRADLAEALYQTHSYTKAAEALDGDNKRLEKRSPALYWLLKSSIDVALERDTLAWNEYRKGLGFLKREDEANEYYDDIRYIVTDDESAQFKNSDMAGKRTFFFVFWKSRDPTLTTDFNERFPEHYMRLRYALQYNKRYPEDQDFSYFLGEKDAAMAVAEPMTRFGKSRECVSQQMIDDMGVIFVRHGKPDMFYIGGPGGADPGVQLSMPAVPAEKRSLRPGKAAEWVIPRASGRGGGTLGSLPMANISLIYEARYGRPAMVFHFWRSGRIDPDGSFAMRKNRAYRGWILRLSMLYPPGRREAELNYVYFPRDPMSIPNAISISTSTTTTDYRPERALRFLYEPYVYKEGAAEKLFLYMNTPEDGSGKTKAGTIPEYDVVLLDKEWKTYFTSSGNDARSVDTGDPTLRYIEVEAVPGVYTLGMRARDNEAGAEGSSSERLVIPDLHSGGLALSSLLLADLEPNRHLFLPEHRAHRIAGLISPNMRKTYHRECPLVVYFEIYNLIRDQNGHSDASVSLNILRHSASGGSPGRSAAASGVEMEHTLRGTLRDEKYLQSIDLSHCRPGSYVLRITVTDKRVDSQVSKDVSFTISR